MRLWVSSARWVAVGVTDGVVPGVTVGGSDDVVLETAGVVTAVVPVPEVFVALEPLVGVVLPAVVEVVVAGVVVLPEVVEPVGVVVLVEVVDSSG